MYRYGVSAEAQMDHHVDKASFREWWCHPRGVMRGLRKRRIGNVLPNSCMPKGSRGLMWRQPPPPPPPRHTNTPPRTLSPLPQCYDVLNRRAQA